MGIASLSGPGQLSISSLTEVRVGNIYIYHHKTLKICFIKKVMQVDTRLEKFAGKKNMFWDTRLEISKFTQLEPTLRHHTLSSRFGLEINLDPRPSR